MTSQGSASGRFTRAIKQRNLFAAEVALKEMGNPSLLVALDYLAERSPAHRLASAASASCDSASVITPPPSA